MKSRIVQAKKHSQTSERFWRTYASQWRAGRGGWSVASSPLWNMEAKLGPWTETLFNIINTAEMFIFIKNAQDVRHWQNQQRRTNEQRSRYKTIMLGQANCFGHSTRREATCINWKNKRKKVLWKTAWAVLWAQHLPEGSLNYGHQGLLSWHLESHINTCWIEMCCPNETSFTSEVPSRGFSPATSKKVIKIFYNFTQNSTV